MILFRYIFSQVASTALAAVGLFVFVLVTGNALRDMVGLLTGGRLGLGFFFEMLCLLIPYVVAYALPLGFLSAVLIVFGRLSSQQEITAMKAAGVSLCRITLPVFCLAFIGVGVCLFVNLDYAPRARMSYRERVANAFTEDPFQFIQPQQFIDQFPGFVLYADGLDGRSLIGLNIWELNHKNQVKTVLKADRGTFRYAPNEDSLVLDLQHGSGERRSRPDLSTLDQPESAPTLFFEEGTLKLPLSGVLKKTTVHKKLSLLTAPELLERRTQALKREEEGDPKAFRERIAVQMQLQKGIANAFSALALVAIAIPLAIRVRRSETYANLALALGLAMAYYLSMVLLTWLEGLPALRPDLLVWLPNCLFMIAGAVGLYRLSQN